MTDDNKPPSREEFKRLRETVAAQSEVIENYLPDDPQKRKFLGEAAKGLGAVGALGIAGQSGYAVGQASAEASTSDTDTDIGSPNNRHDLFADGVDANSVNAGKLFDEQDILLYSGSGNLIETLDPDSTTTPIQDALATISADGGGTIVLPPVPNSIIDDPGPINWESNCHMVGHGMSTSKIRITDSTSDGLVFDTAGMNDVSFRGFGLFNQNGPGGTTGVPYHVTARVYDLFMDRVKFQGWSDIAIKWDTGLNLSNLHHGDVRIVNTDAGDKNALIDLQSGGPNNSFESINVSASSSRSGSDSRGLFCDVGGSLKIGQLNLGGSIGVGATLQAVRNCKIGGIHYEPNDQLASAAEVLATGGDTNHWIGGVRMAAGTVDYVVSISGGAEEFIGHVQQDGTSTLNNTKVKIRKDPSEQSIVYAGPSADVTNTTGGTLTNGVACLGDLTIVT